jgi:hypothetical protein
VDVVCRDDVLEIPDSHSSRLRLSCPSCERVLADIYDAGLEIKPVANARISRG